jgi:hypothetical protein
MESNWKDSDDILRTGNLTDVVKYIAGIIDYPDDYEITCEKACAIVGQRFKIHPDTVNGMATNVLLQLRIDEVSSDE